MFGKKVFFLSNHSTSQALHSSNYQLRINDSLFESSSELKPKVVEQAVYTGVNMPITAIAAATRPVWYAQEFFSFCDDVNLTLTAAEER